LKCEKILNPEPNIGPHVIFFYKHMKFQNQARLCQ